MKAQSLAVCCALALLISPAGVAQAPSPAAEANATGDVTYDFSFIPPNSPRITVNRAGTGFLLLGRTNLTSSADPLDYRSFALTVAAQRNPRLLEQLFVRAFRQTVTTDEAGVVFVNTASLMRAATLKSVAVLQASGVQLYLDTVVLPALTANPSVDPETLPAFTAPWYEPPEAEACPQPWVYLHRTVCVPCSNPTDPGGPCGNQCMKDCVGIGFTCVEWIPGALESMSP